MKCNRDCFHCTHNDCINDEITEEERKLSDKLEIQSKLNKLDNRSIPKFLSSQKYREAHREQNKARVKAWIENNPDKYKEAQARWREAHKGQERDRNKINYEKLKNNERRREQLRAADKRYREKKRMERVS